MANLEHVKVVKEGAESIKEWRQKHPNEILDLRKADIRKLELHDADLSKVNLTGANLLDANLDIVDLSYAKLAETRLSGAMLFLCDLSETDLSKANISFGQFLYTDLSKATLTEARLAATNFYRTQLLKTCFIDSEMSLAQISGCDLSQCIGLETVKHKGPSSIDIETLISSFGGAGKRFTPKMETFFLNAGVPKEFLDMLPGILTGLKYCSCFVAYGQPDVAFAKSLVKDLKAKGVSCWLYDMDATPGKRTWEEITLERREAEKMIILCSAKSLVRDGVKKEIEEQIDEDPDKMVPISLDDLWQEEGFTVKRGQRDLKLFLLERNYADFCDESKYNDSLNRLLKGIRRA